MMNNERSNLVFNLLRRILEECDWVDLDVNPDRTAHSLKVDGSVYGLSVDETALVLQILNEVDQ